MMTPDKKTKKKNILTALAILVFMVFLFFFTLNKEIVGILLILLSQILD